MATTFPQICKGTDAMYSNTLKKGCYDDKRNTNLIMSEGRKYILEMLIL
jgi:hypothetical protein